MDIEELLAQIRLPTDVVPLCLRGDLIAEWARLERDFRAANSTLDDEVTPAGVSTRAVAIARQMEGMRAEMQAATRLFSLQAVRRPEWGKLVKAHSKGPDEVDEDAFSVAIVAACCTDPVMTVAQAERLRDELTDGQWETLGKAVMALNRTSPGVPYSQAAAVQAVVGEA